MILDRAPDFNKADLLGEERNDKYDEIRTPLVVAAASAISVVVVVVVSSSISVIWRRRRLQQ